MGRSTERVCADSQSRRIRFGQCTTRRAQFHVRRPCRAARFEMEIAPRAFERSGCSWLVRAVTLLKCAHAPFCDTRIVELRSCLGEKLNNHRRKNRSAISFLICSYETPTTRPSSTAFSALVFPLPTPRQSLRNRPLNTVLTARFM